MPNTSSDYKLLSKIRKSKQVPSYRVISGYDYHKITETRGEREYAQTLLIMRSPKTNPRGSWYEGEEILDNRLDWDADEKTVTDIGALECKKRGFSVFVYEKEGEGWLIYFREILGESFLLYNRTVPPESSDSLTAFAPKPIIKHPNSIGYGLISCVYLVGHEKKIFNYSDISKISYSGSNRRLYAFIDYQRVKDNHIDR